MKNYLSANRPMRHLMPRQSLSATELHALWRIESGAMRIDSIAPDGTSNFVRLTLPGDILGIENLVGVNDTLKISALTPCILIPLCFNEETQLTALLMESITTNHQHCREIVNLRTGAVMDRVKCLLQLLKSSNGNAWTLPSLGNIAEIINSTRETVCRIMTNLREANFLMDCNPVHAKYTPLENREHRLQTENYAITHHQ